MKCTEVHNCIQAMVFTLSVKVSTLGVLIVVLGVFRIPTQLEIYLLEWLYLKRTKFNKLFIISYFNHFRCYLRKINYNLFSYKHFDLIYEK